MQLIAHLATATKACPDWCPKYYRKGTKKVAEALPPLIKFLDIGTKMGSYEIKELIPVTNDKSDILHPRSAASGIPKPGTFYEVLYRRLGKTRSDESAWCDASAWVKHSTTFDFHARDAFGYAWRLPILVPTCPRKLFEQGPRKRYVDIVTDTLHASDLIKWNTLAMIRLKLQDFIPVLWQEIAVASLDAWDKRDQQETFLTDNRRGYARVTPIGLTSTGAPSQTPLPADQYPLHGLGFYDETKSSTQFATYVWSSSSKAIQPMHVDGSLVNMLSGPGGR